MKGVTTNIIESAFSWFLLNPSIMSLLLTLTFFLGKLSKSKYIRPFCYKIFVRIQIRRLELKSQLMYVRIKL